jgi:hypothetical protein
MKFWHTWLLSALVCIGFWPMPSATALSSLASPSLKNSAAHADAQGPLLELARGHDGQDDPYANESTSPSHKNTKGHKNPKSRSGHKKSASQRFDEHQRQEENFRGPFFTERQMPYFQRCYGAQDISDLPPGLRKHVERTGHLPPGLEMQLERNGHLPPGLEKRMAPASPCIVRQIGALPPYTRLYLYGRDAVLLNEHTQAIVDILRGAY